MRRFYFISVLTLGCAIGMGWLTSSETVTAQAPVANATMSGHLKGGALGAVRTAQGRMVDGLMVQLISDKSGIRTTVYTDEAGRYEFPVLESGEYVLRVPRPLEFRQYTRRGVHRRPDTAR